MLGCMMPMSSPMMKRMLGFCAVCAAAGVLASPDAAINADAPSSAAQVRARQLVFVVLAPSPVLAGVLSMPISHGLALLFVMHQIASRLTHRKPTWLVDVSTSFA